MCLLVYTLDKYTVLKFLFKKTDSTIVHVCVKLEIMHLFN